MSNAANPSAPIRSIIHGYGEGEDGYRRRIAKQKAHARQDGADANPEWDNVEQVLRFMLSFLCGRRAEATAETTTQDLQTPQPERHKVTVRSECSHAKERRDRMMSCCRVCSTSS